MTDPRTELVGRGYDKIGERFAEWRDQIVGDPRREWEEELVSRLQDGAHVLELGCGAGVPDTQRLAGRFQVTGVDVSAEQVRRAQAAVPEARFIHADFTTLELEPESLDAVSPSMPSITCPASCSRGRSRESIGGSCRAVCS